MENLHSNKQPVLAVDEKPIPRTNELKKILGVAFGITVLVGGTIGSGILRNPGTITQLLNNYWLIIGCWLFGGFYVLLGVNAFSELATMLPRAGGSYNYVKRAFGNYAGFLTGWFDFISNGNRACIFLHPDRRIPYFAVSRIERL